MLKNIIESFSETDRVINFSAKTKERIGPKGVKEISETANWPSMTKFNINMNDIEDEGIEWLIKCPWSKLESIDLSRNKLTHVGAATLRKADWLGLIKLDISNNNIGAEGVFHLQQCAWPRLKEINLEKNDIGSAGALHLVKTDWPNLQSINFNLNNIGDKGARYLSLTNWPNLAFANLCYNNIEGEGMYYLAKARWPKLQVMMLNRNNIGYVKGKYSDLGCFYLSQMNIRLKQLEILGNSISTQGILMVLYSGMIGNDSTVIIRNNLYNDKAIERETKQIIQKKNIRIPFTVG